MGFTSGGCSRSFRRKYERQMLVANVISHGFPRGQQGKIEVKITFLKSDVIGTNPHGNDPMVITYNMKTRTSSES